MCFALGFVLFISVPVFLLVTNLPKKKLVVVYVEILLAIAELPQL